MKIIFAVQLTPKIESGPDAERRGSLLVVADGLQRHAEPAP
jgi:hypothetical protein